MDNDPICPEIERPDEHQEIGNEIYCWLPGNFDRECNGSCVAFDIIFESDQRRSPCSIINMMKSAALSHAKIANVGQVEARMAAVPNQPPPKVL
jgi:hypothetical protein